tara:strand:- start:139 stop:564 length:426 start_codon:yes stop_codon:yes gene_type:complete
MAIQTGNGTETLQSSLWEDSANTERQLIVGVQHHIYTVVSVIMKGIAVSSVANRTASLYIRGYDRVAGAYSAIGLMSWEVAVGETFVFNDKFSFMGYIPDANTQIAVPLQAGGTSQKLSIETDHADTRMDVVCTYIDQDWS